MANLSTAADVEDVMDTMEVIVADAKEDTAQKRETAAADAINMKTAVVILNWNTEGFLKEFLPGLISSVRKTDGAEVVVADNASTDNSMTVMKELFPEIRTISLDRNYGFTGGYNRAFNEIESDYFVLINSDIEVTDGWLEPLVSWMDTHPECGACAPKLHSYQERNMFEYAGAAGGYIDRFGYPFCRGRILKRIEEDKGQYDYPADVFWATGACLMVRSETYRESGGLDERFFAHMEEIDLCWRMQLAGMKVTVVPESMVYHVGGGTLPATSPFKLFLNFRNNLMMLSKNLGKTYALMAYRKGMEADKAARKGYRKAGRMIFFRKCLDGLSALVYLITFRTECFKAVVKAHNEYKKTDRSPDCRQIADYLRRNGNTASVNGLYKKWIVLISMFKGRRSFNSISEQDFHKFG